MTSRFGRVGTLFLGASGVAMLGVALFPAEIDVAAPSRSGQLHDLSALIYFFTTAVGALLLSWTFRNHQRWRKYSRSEMILAVLVAVAFLLFFTVYPLQADSTPMVPQLRPLIGLFQRALIFLIWLWLSVTTVRVRQLASH